MDLFHAVTQGIENVLTCDWYDGFKTFKMDDNKNQDKLMDTVPGGETTQYLFLPSTCLDTDKWPRYESIKTETVPTAKQRGQLGGQCRDLSPSF